MLKLYCGLVEDWVNYVNANGITQADISHIDISTSNGQKYITVLYWEN